MTTFTSRWGFPQIVISPTSDNVDVVTDFNTPWATLDTKLYGVCTSSTRPSAPVQGQHTFETDTGFTRVWTGSAWKTAGNAIGTSGARPASPIQGDEFYETDTGYSRSRGSAAWNGFLPVCTVSTLPANPIAGDEVYLSDKECTARYTGTQWHTIGPVVCTSSTHPTSSGITLYSGMTIYETDTSRFLIYNGTTFIVQTSANFVCTSTTHPANPFVGLEIYETDTGLSAVYTGSAYYYPPQLWQSQTVVGTTTGTLTFNNIPQVGKTLKVVMRVKTAAATTFDTILYTINNTTSANYNFFIQSITNAGAPTNQNATSQTSGTCAIAWGNGTATNGAGLNEVLFPDYSIAGFAKGCRFSGFASDGNTSGESWQGGSMLKSTITTAAITRLDFTTGSGNYTAGSTIDVYIM